MFNFKNRIDFKVNHIKSGVTDFIVSKILWEGLKFGTLSDLAGST